MQRTRGWATRGSLHARMAMFVAFFAQLFVLFVAPGNAASTLRGTKEDGEIPVIAAPPPQRPLTFPPRQLPAKVPTASRGSQWRSVQAWEASADSNPAARGPPASPSEIKEAQIEHLKTLKEAAITAEDYDTAKMLKAKIDMLEQPTEEEMDAMLGPVRPMGFASLAAPVGAMAAAPLWHPLPIPMAEAAAVAPARGQSDPATFSYPLLGVRPAAQAQVLTPPLPMQATQPVFATMAPLPPLAPPVEITAAPIAAAVPLPAPSGALEMPVATAPMTASEGDDWIRKEWNQRMARPGAPHLSKAAENRMYLKFRAAMERKQAQNLVAPPGQAPMQQAPAAMPPAETPLQPQPTDQGDDWIRQVWEKRMSQPGAPHLSKDQEERLFNSFRAKMQQRAQKTQAAEMESPIVPLAVVPPDPIAVAQPPTLEVPEIAQTPVPPAAIETIDTVTAAPSAAVATQAAAQGQAADSFDEQINKLWEKRMSQPGAPHLSQQAAARLKARFAAKLKGKLQAQHAAPVANAPPQGAVDAPVPLVQPAALPPPAPVANDPPAVVPPQPSASGVAPAQTAIEAIAPPAPVAASMPAAVVPQLTPATPQATQAAASATSEMDKYLAWIHGAKTLKTSSKPTLGMMR